MASQPNQIEEEVAKAALRSAIENFDRYILILEKILQNFQYADHNSALMDQQIANLKSIQTEQKRTRDYLYEQLRKIR